MKTAIVLIGLLLPIAANAQSRPPYAPGGIYQPSNQFIPQKPDLCNTGSYFCKLWYNPNEPKRLHRLDPSLPSNKRMG